MTASLDASSSRSAYPREPSDGGSRGWPALAEMLLEEFPDATISDVVRELRCARDAVAQVTIDADESLEIAGAIARNQLNILTRRVTDTARLDPERHRRLARSVGQPG